MTRYVIPTSSRSIVIDEPDPEALADPDPKRSRVEQRRLGFELPDGCRSCHADVLLELANAGGA